MGKKYKKEVSYAFVHNTAKQIFYKSYKDAYDAYHNREGKSELGLIQNKKVIMILNTKMISVRWAIACASRVLYIFEKKYPDDLRPRQALEAATRWLNAPTETNRMMANAAADVIDDAVDADWAVWAAANAAAMAAYAVVFSDYAACTTARAVVAAADAADARSKEIAWQRRCLQSIVDKYIAKDLFIKSQYQKIDGLKQIRPQELNKMIWFYI